MANVRDNAEKSRFELDVEGEVAFRQPALAEAAIS